MPAWPRVPPVAMARSSGRTPIGRRGSPSNTRRRRPSRMRQRVRGSIATPATGLTARARIGDLPAGQDIFYRVILEDASNARTHERSRVRSLSDGAGARQARSRRVDRGCLRTGMGHRSVARRHAAVQTDGGCQSRFIRARRRHDLRRRSVARRSDAGRRHGVEEHRHAGEIEGRRNARRVSRQSLVQPPRRALPPVSIGGRADRDVGRSRSPRQLVSPAGAARDGALHRKARRRCSPRGRGRRSSSSIR